MSGFPFSQSNLPLVERGILENSIDWVDFFGSLAQKGPAILLESAGKIHDSNLWIILAGKAEKEFFERDGKTWLRDPSGLHSSPIGLSEFLDQAGRVEFTGNDQRSLTVMPWQVNQLNEKNKHTPFPYCLREGWFGAFSYDLATTAKKKSVPDFYFFKPSCVLAFNRKTKEYFSFGVPFEGLDRVHPAATDPFRVSAIIPQSSPEKYEAMVRQAQKYIGQGDIYQANLSQSFRAQWGGNATNLYRLLKETNPAPFMGVLRGRGFTIVSSSPERLICGEGDRLEMKPIAGTRPRGQDETQDLQLLFELKTNPKEQAEHLMLVDLARNDLGRLARYGTVAVTHYAEVESFAKVHHLVSTLQATRKKSVTFSEMLRSVFPGGTITGCPKIRCMEIIQELELAPRGFYTGSMGYLAPGPSFDFNILIRSLTLFDDGELDFRAGAGIVADSDPQKEYLETLYKVEALAQALGSSLLNKS